MNKKLKIFLVFIILAAMGAAIYFIERIEVVEEFLYKLAAGESGGQLFLASMYNNIESYSDVLAGLQKPVEDSAVKAGIVSHHFLAKQLIADFYNKIASEKELTIYLLSPDHFNNFFPSGAIAYTSELSWKTPFGDVPAGKKIINSLVKEGVVTQNDSLLGLEHGIYVEIPFIKNFFPNAKIVPLVLNMAAGSDAFSALGEKLQSQDSILIVSSDFSHEVSAKTASLQDKESVQALKDLSLENLSLVNSDCKQCLAVLEGFLGNSQNYSFNLIDNKNSSDFEENASSNSVTSYVTGFWTPKKDLQILFAGDLMFDRGIRYYANKNEGNEFIFDKIYPALANNDLVVVNLEGPITDNKSVSSGTIPGSTNNYSFTFDPSVAQTLYRENIKLVNLGNNHILNFGDMSPVSTEKYLAQANVDYFGSPRSNRSIVKDIAGVKVAFVAYNEFYADTQAQVEQEIAKIKPEADIVVVFCHWGIEYNLEATDGQKDLSHKFIDAGADLIIGSHPHVIEPMEEYNGPDGQSKRIYYSLGNFIFDQYFNENVRNGMGVKLKIDLETKELSFEEIKFYLGPSGQTLVK
jgi:poly-gamma-glutamate synthesis protein (capsule biosynthesis protein)